jgi:diguanylate cyclase (GGDEF)-like protein
MDDLTHIPNRRAFNELAQIEIQRSRRDLTPLTVAFVDIDNFKWINDKRGHQEGDLLLKQVALTLRANLRATDFAARLGGDEFAFLLPHATDVIARKVLEKVHYGLMGMARSNDWPVAFSMGAVTFSRPPKNIEELLLKPDSLMYEVKRNKEQAFRHEVVLQQAEEESTTFASRASS